MAHGAVRPSYGLQKLARVVAVESGPRPVAVGPEAGTPLFPASVPGMIGRVSTGEN